MDLFDNGGGTDGCWRYACDIVDHASHYVVGLAALLDKSAAGVLAVVSGVGGAGSEPAGALLLVPALV